MRKVLKVSTALILSLVMVLGMAVVSLAASKENVVEIVKAVDDDGNDVAYTLGEVSGWPPLTEEIAAKKIGGGVKADELTVLWQYDLCQVGALIDRVVIYFNKAFRQCDFIQFYIALKNQISEPL